jgi:hypothetical protein
MNENHTNRLGQNCFLVVGTSQIGVRCTAGVADEEAAKRHAAAWIEAGFKDVKVVDRRTLSPTC